jgi:hypothetical protein
MPSSDETPIPLDPETVRQITPDSANDDAGLAAMMQLKPSGSSPVHFLVPLPGAISRSALDLFGFWTYELRCGHLQWSTAQGRYGRAFRVAGMQHPCPPVIANVERIVTTPSNGGAKHLASFPPRTSRRPFSTASRLPRRQSRKHRFGSCSMLNCGVPMARPVAISCSARPRGDSRYPGGSSRMLPASLNSKRSP